MKLPAIKLVTNMLLTGLIGFVNVGDQVTPLVPQKYKPLVTGALALAAAIVSLAGHKSTSDGQKIVPGVPVTQSK